MASKFVKGPHPRGPTGKTGPTGGAGPTGSTGPTPRPAAEFPLGFPPTVIPPGGCVDVVSRPSIGFKPRRIIAVGGEDHAVIEGIEIGGQDQLAGGAGIPAAAFAPSALGVRLDMIGARPGQEIVLKVSSVKGGRFTAMMLGEQLDLPPLPEPLVEEAIAAVKEAEEAYEPGVTLDEATGQLRGDD